MGSWPTTSTAGARPRPAGRSGRQLPRTRLLLTEEGTAPVMAYPDSGPLADGQWAGPGGARPGGRGEAGGLAAGPGTLDAGLSAAEQLDRLGNHLAMAGWRLARLRARLDSTEDRLMLIQARYDLDEAIAEVRRLALSARQREGS